MALVVAILSPVAAVLRYTHGPCATQLVILAGSVSALGGVFSPLSKARNESQKEAEDAYDMIVQTWMQVMETKQAVELYYEAFCDLKCELLSFPTPTRNKVWCKANTRRCNELYAIFNEFAM
ncbi:hypothetical protein FRB98_000963 [Tulasnella sp. 332]|nr:hypothetical protein FRB98_000963 [Tulasnella sp. 332]